MKVFFFFFFCCCFLFPCFAADTNQTQTQTAQLLIDASKQSGRPISPTLFGIFFEEINHAGAGGLWAELVNNRGFEAGGPNTPSNIDPWSIIGNESSLLVSTDRSSPFERNKVALRMEVLCADNTCPAGGVGIYNPGFWGMNVEKGKTYTVILYVRSSGPINVSVSLTSSDGLQTLASDNIIASVSPVSNWTKFKLLLEAKGTNPSSRLQLTTTRKGLIWFDQVSVMPSDTYEGHGFRKDLVDMMADLKPQFIRFPGQFWPRIHAPLAQAPTQAHALALHTSKLLAAAPSYSLPPTCVFSLLPIALVAQKQPISSCFCPLQFSL